PGEHLGLGPGGPELLRRAVDAPLVDQPVLAVATLTPPGVRLDRRAAARGRARACGCLHGSPLAERTHPSASPGQSEPFPASARNHPTAHFAPSGLTRPRPLRGPIRCLETHRIG